MYTVSREGITTGEMDPRE